MEMYREKRTQTFYESHLVWKLQTRMPSTFFKTCILRRNLHEKTQINIADYAWTFTGKMPPAPVNTSTEHWVLTVTGRTPQCGLTVWGINCNYISEVASRYCEPAT